MKISIIVISFIICASVTQAEEMVQRGYSFISKLWGQTYSSRITELDLKQAATFDPETEHPPLGVHEAISKARIWIEDSFPQPPEWLDSVQWHLHEVALELVKEPNYWCYQITFKPSRDGDSAIWTERFVVVILMNGRVIEPTCEKKTDSATISAPPPLKPSVPGQMNQLNFKDSPIQHVMDFYSNMSGWKYVIASNTYASITIQPGRRCTPDEALSLIEKALNAQGIILDKVSDDEISVRRNIK